LAAARRRRMRRMAWQRWRQHGGGEGVTGLVGSEEEEVGVAALAAEDIRRLYEHHCGDLFKQEHQNDNNVPFCRFCMIIILDSPIIVTICPIKINNEWYQFVFLNK
jgi:hypothetical protein